MSNAQSERGRSKYFFTAPSGCVPMLQGLSSLPAGLFGSAVASVEDKSFSGGWIMVTANRGDLQRKIDWNSKTQARLGTPARGSNHHRNTADGGRISPRSAAYRQ